MLYMLLEDVERVGYTDLVGVGKHISKLERVADERYEDLTLGTLTTHIQVTVKGRTVRYNF